MKVLVVTASRYGSTTGIGAAIAEVLRERGFETETAPALHAPGPERYGAVIVGSGVYMGHWLDAARVYIERHAMELRERPVWLFSSGPLGNPLKPDETHAVSIDHLLGYSRAKQHRLFAGALERRRLNFADKAISMALHAPEGDFRDWDAIRGWAESIAATLVAIPATA
ncbi:MAG: flavodoxin domain-containing protein [Chloroflexi bacterium]|nr:flavodoxin domain-containing protein [Chloroflexota bacterium]